MYDHIRLSTLYKHGQLESGKTDDKPVKNIIKPILNVAYRSEGFDVKDITPFVNSSKDSYKSFLVRKYHNRWARKWNIDTFIDEMVESYTDFGLSLVKNVNQERPEVVPLQRIAFCDQTDILAGVIAEKHSYAIEELLDMKWDKANVELAILAAKAEKSSANPQGQVKAETPQKYIEVYELHGMMPTKWLSKSEDDEYANADDNSYTRQAHYVTFATKENKENKKGITLWKGKETKIRYKAIKRDAIFGRAAGYGGVEELIDDQVWTTYSQIKIKAILDAAALMLLQTEDEAFRERNKTSELESGEILIHAPDKPITQVQMNAVNMTAFDNWTAQWDQHARTTGSASESALQVRPASGTPFSLEQLNVQNGQEMHLYRQGKLATFMGEIYRDWTLEYFGREMAKGDEWVDDLTLEEIQWVSDQIANNEVTRHAIEAFRKGGALYEDEGEQIKELIKTEFKKKGSKHFIEIFKNEMKSLPIDVEVNIAGKQKDLSKMTDKLTNIFRQIIANPAVLQIPGIVQIFNQILEASGLNPADFSTLVRQTAPVQQTSLAPAVEDVSTKKEATAIA